MTRNDHKPLTTGFVPAIKRQIGSFKRLFSNQKPTSVHIEEDFEDIERILVSNTYNLVNKRPVDGKSDKNADNLDVNELKEATKALKDYTNGLKEATHELKRLKKAQMEIKSPTKLQIEAKRAQTKTNLSKNVQNSKNVASKSSKEAKNSKNTPKRT